MVGENDYLSCTMPGPIASREQILTTRQNYENSIGSSVGNAYPRQPMGDHISTCFGELLRAHTSSAIDRIKNYKAPHEH